MNIVFSAHDAGGANSILPILKTFPKKHKALVLVDGPAALIFRNNKVKYSPVKGLSKSAILKCLKRFDAEVLIAGTSLGDTIDKKILEVMRKQNKPSIYIVDFWSNYFQRFSKRNHDLFYLPTLICVADEIMRSEMIAQGFSAEILKVTGNPYYDSIKARVSVTPANKKNILFVSQPITKINSSKVANQYNFNEYDVLEDLIEILVKSKNKFELYIQTHPSENKKKFIKLFKKSAITPRFGNNDLEKSLNESGLVVGMNSAALLVAAILKKNIVSYLPADMVRGKIVRARLGVENVAYTFNELDYFVNGYLSEKVKLKSKKIHLVKGATHKVLELIKQYGKN